jgi:hypothetical protein
MAILSAFLFSDEPGQRVFRGHWAIRLGDQLPTAAFVSLGVLMAVCFKQLLESHSEQVSSQCTVIKHSLVQDSLPLLLSLAVGLTLLKKCVFPRLIVPDQFQESMDLGKYYGFAAQISYHWLLVVGYITVLLFHGRDTGRLYQFLTLAEPAYCTFDVLLFAMTGVSFTNWQVKPLLVHHAISCACTHALLYGMPCSVYGIWLQLILHGSSAICLGIANAVSTPALNLRAVQNVSLQLFSLLVWGVSRVCLLLVLGVCLILDAQQLTAARHRRLVTVELAVAAAASMLFVVIKTPIIMDGLRKAVRDYECAEPLNGEDSMCSSIGEKCFEDENDSDAETDVPTYWPSTGASDLASCSNNASCADLASLADMLQSEDCARSWSKVTASTSCTYQSEECTRGLSKASSASAFCGHQ